MRTLRNTLLSLLIFCAVTAVVCGDVLTTVKDVRSLTLREAARNLPVRISGIVVFYNPVDGHAFIHNGGESIFFRAPKGINPSGESSLVGQKVVIEGYTVAGFYSPSIAGLEPTQEGRMRKTTVTLQVLGPGVMPIPRKILPYEVGKGVHHDQFVEVEMTVRFANQFEDGNHQRTFLALTGLDTNFLPAFLNESLPGAETLTNIPASLIGVIGGGGDPSGRLSEVRFHIQNSSDITFYKEELEKIFTSPPIAWEQIFGYQPRTRSPLSNRVKVTGVVTVGRPAEEFYISNGKTGLRVQTQQKEGIVSGALVDVVGIPSVNGTTEYLGDAILRTTGIGPLPPVQNITFEEAKSGNFEGAVVSVKGYFVEKIQQEHLMTLFFMSNENRFSFRSTEGIPDYQWPKPGSYVSVTGVCELPPTGPLLGPPLATFSILAMDQDALQILKGPPLLTLERARLILAGTSTALLLGFLFLLVLKKQVARQSVQIARQLEQQAITDERQRMARELHDTLDQHLAGIQIQLNAVEAWGKNAPAGIMKALLSAKAMLQHSRDETRRSVFELRSQALEKYGLIGAVEQHLVQAGEDPPPTIQLVVNGEKVSFGSRVHFHLLRMIQEAVQNAIRHANATTIIVHFDFQADQLVLTISDDGIGFDKSAKAPDARPRYGLRGQQERAGKVNAELTIKSSIGNGTTVKILLPIKR